MPKKPKTKLFLLRFILILILAGFLIIYHGSKIAMAMFQTDTPPYTVSDILVLGSRALILLSLLLVIVKKRIGLWAMWASITGLIALQYLIHFDIIALEAKPIKHPLSYLRGFMLPTLISLLAIGFFPKTDKIHDVET